MPRKNEKTRPLASADMDDGMDDWVDGIGPVNVKTSFIQKTTTNYMDAKQLVIIPFMFFGKYKNCMSCEQIIRAYF